MAIPLQSYLKDLHQTWRLVTKKPLAVWSADDHPQGMPELLLGYMTRTDIQYPQHIRDGNTSWVLHASEKIKPRVFLACPNGDESEVRLLKTLVGWMDQLAEERQASDELTRELLFSWERLNFVLEMAKIVGQHSEIQPMVQSLAQSLQKVIPADDVWLALGDGSGTRVYNASGQPITHMQAVLSIARRKRQKIVVLQRDELTEPLVSENPTLKNLIIVPLDLDEKGWLGLINHPTANLMSGDQQLLLSVAEQISTIINAALSRAEQEDSKRINHELEIANQIQSSMLPRSMPEVTGVEFAARLIPAHRVGGDFYDVQQVPNGIAMMVSDVAGKGVPAAMITSLMHATLKGEAQRHSDPATLLKSINRLLYDELDRTDTFVTAFLAVLHTTIPMRLTYASAGHTTSLLWSDNRGEVIQLPSTGLPLGLMPNLEITQHDVPFGQRDVVMLYSDGVTEAEDGGGKVFGMQALVDLILAFHPAPIEVQMETFFKALDLHRGNTPLRDDVAMFMARSRSMGTDKLFTSITPFVYDVNKRSIRELAILSRSLAEELLRFENPASKQTFLEDLELAVSEITTNIVLHAYGEKPGRIQGRITTNVNEIVIDMIDSGVLYFPQEPEREFSVLDPPMSGYGLNIAEQLLEDCTYTRLRNQRNHWQLRKVLH